MLAEVIEEDDDEGEEDEGEEEPEPKDDEPAPAAPAASSSNNGRNKAVPRHQWYPTRLPPRQRRQRSAPAAVRASHASGYMIASM